MHDINDDAGFGVAGHVMSYRTAQTGASQGITARASQGMIETHRAQLNYMSERLMPDNLSHNLEGYTF